MNLVEKFIKDESAATAIEYGLLAALVSVVLIGALQLLGNALNSSFELLSAEIKGDGPQPGPPRTAQPTPPAAIIGGG